MKLWYHSFVRN